MTLKMRINPKHPQVNGVTKINKMENLQDYVENIWK